MKKLYQNSLYLEGYRTLDMAIFIKNIKGQYLWANDFFVQKAAGYQSVNEIIRKQDHQFVWHEYSDNFKNSDKLLVETLECITVKERNLRHDGNYVNIVSKKNPIFDSRDRLVGLIGFCIEIPVSIGLKNLSKREYATVALLAQGKTDKEIGKLLDISPRTAETYINNAKIKLKVTTRSELICKFLT